MHTGATASQCLATVALSCSLLACGQADPVAPEAGGTLPARRPGITLRGAGATFPFALYSKWALGFYERTGLRISYQPSSSEAGVAAIVRGDVDFGATDLPLEPAELEAHDLIQFPVVIGAVVPVFNLPGVGPGELKLTAEALAGIYLGRVRRWNDLVLRAINPGLELPDAEIIPLRRLEPSGTTWIFTRFLDRLSPLWHVRAGPSAKADWRVGVSARGNAQVAKFVRQFKHTLGYVEYSFVTSHDLAWAQVRNAAGVFASPSLAAFEAGAERGTWQLGLPEPGGPHSAPAAAGADREALLQAAWPVMGASYVLMRRHQHDVERSRWMLRFFHWALGDGAQLAGPLHYVTVPARLLPQIEALWAEALSADGEPVWSDREEE